MTESLDSIELVDSSQEGTALAYESGRDWVPAGFGMALPDFERVSKSDSGHGS